MGGSARLGASAKAPTAGIAERVDAAVGSCRLGCKPARSGRLGAAAEASDPGLSPRSAPLGNRPGGLPAPRRAVAATGCYRHR